VDNEPKEGYLSSKSPKWTELYKQLEVPTNEGLAEILIRLTSLEATIGIIANAIPFLMEDENSPNEEIDNKFKQKQKEVFLEGIESLILRYHKSDAPE